MDEKLQSTFSAIEQTVQKEVNAKFEEARMAANKRLYELGFDAACRKYKVGKYAE